MAEDKGLLADIYQLYYDKARQAQASGQIALAKRNYLLAAETLMKMAKDSSPQLKKSQFEHAKRMIALADDLSVSAPTSTAKPQATSGQESDEKGKDWKGAEIPNIHFSDIAGLVEVKRAITTRMINPIKYPEKYELYGKKTGGGVLLYGPPGTGKTMIAKAIACEVGATFYAIKGSDIMSKWVGESEKNIRSLFETARRDPLAIIFIDEMDSLFARRGEDAHNDKRVNEFLQQMDGFMGQCPHLLLLGATNRPWDIDGAAMRSGRFSQKIYVPLPDASARLFLFNKWLRSIPLDKDVDIDELVELSEGRSGADIEEICDRAKETPLLRCIESGEVVDVTRADFIDAISAVRSSLQKGEIELFEKYAEG